MEKRYSISEVSRITGVTRKTILAKINRGEISALRIGKRFMVPQSEMDRCFDLPVTAYAKKEPSTNQAEAADPAAPTPTEMDQLRYEVAKLRGDNLHLEDVRRLLEGQLEEYKRRLDAAEEMQSRLVALLQVEQQPRRLGFTERVGKAFSVLLGKDVGKA